MSFDPVVYAHEELLPLLGTLTALAEEEGESEQRAFFAGIQRGVERARVAEDLADPFMALSMSAFRGFAFSPHVAILLDQLLERAQRLSESLSLDPDEVH